MARRNGPPQKTFRETLEGLQTLVQMQQQLISHALDQLQPAEVAGKQNTGKRDAGRPEGQGSGKRRSLG